MHTNNKLVSLCLFTYMQEDFVAQAVKGVLAQTYSPLEIIISDDCSTDNTFDIIKSITANYQGGAKLIVNRNNKNLGLSAHVNKIFSEAKGEFIVVAAGDDISLPNRVTKYVEAFEKDDGIVSVSCTLKEINQKGAIISKPSTNKSDIIYTLDDYIKDFDLHVNGASRAIRKTVFDKFGDLNTSCPTEDSPYLLRSFMLGKVCLLADELVMYRLHEDNLSNSDNLHKMSIKAIINQYENDIRMAVDFKSINTHQEKALLNKIINIKKKRESNKKDFLKRRAKQFLRNFYERIAHPFVTPINRIYNQLTNTIYLWWCDNEGVFNFGDELNPYLVSKITGKKIVRKKSLWQRFQFRRIYIAIGSVMNKANKNTIVWGSGIIKKNEMLSKSAIYTAVRGPLTQKRMLECGLVPPTIIGDPALLLPLYYTPKITKKYTLGIIPHVVDYHLVKDKLNNTPDVVVIDFTQEIEATIDLIVSCNTLISSSLHGIIVANAYNKPAVWCSFSNNLAGDDVKFYDYFQSVEMMENIEKVKIDSIDINELKTIVLNAEKIKPSMDVIQYIQQQLIENHPF